MPRGIDCALYARSMERASRRALLLLVHFASVIMCARGRAERVRAPAHLRHFRRTKTITLETLRRGAKRRSNARSEATLRRAERSDAPIRGAKRRPHARSEAGEAKRRSNARSEATLRRAERSDAPTRGAKRRSNPFGLDRAERGLV